MVSDVLAGVGDRACPGDIPFGERRPGQRRQLHVGLLFRHFPDHTLECGKAVGDHQKP